MNYIPQIAKMLGVEIGEEFKITGYDGTYRIQDEGLCHVQTNLWEYGEQYNHVFCDVLCGKEEIIKLPFEPKEGETYWLVYWYADCKALGTISIKCEKSSLHMIRKFCGNCFRTKEEAEAHKYEIYKKLTGKEWGE